MSAHDQARESATHSTARTSAGACGARAQWSEAARAAGIAPHERLVVALSGGRDSVALFLLLARAEPRPDLCALHVDHGWRGADGASDAAACVRLAKHHGVPIDVVRLHLSGDAPSAEAYARTERLRCLVAAARATGHHTVVTAHHAEDALEGLLLRWRRTGVPSGWLLPGRRTRVTGAVPGEAPGPRERELSPVDIVHPLADWSRTDIDAFLRSCDATWREDPSNADLRHARNAARCTVVPLLERIGGSNVRATLARLGRATADLDERFEALVPVAERLPHVHLTRAPDRAHLGARFDALSLTSLARGVREEVLARIVVRTVGKAPGRDALAALSAGLEEDRPTRLSLPRGWLATCSRPHLDLWPPDALLGARPAPVEFDGGDVEMDDGRRIAREEIEALISATQVAPLRTPLHVRTAAAGDRLRLARGRPLRALTRTLAELGVPPHERHRVLVLVDASGAVVGLPAASASARE